MPVEIGPYRFPIIRVPGDPDPLVRLELDEFERAGADRMPAHVARRHVTGVDHRPAGGQESNERGLRPLQTKRDPIIAVGDYLFEVLVPGFAGIEAELLGRLAEQQVPGAFDVPRRQPPAVLPLDALAHLHGYVRPLLGSP